jgi:hypothetical protein
MNKRVIAGVLGAAALAVPTAAAADSGHGGGHDKQTAKKVVRDHAKGKHKAVTFVFRGTFAAPGTVQVRAGNAHIHKAGFVGQAVTFDFASARVVVADTNGDAKPDLADVKDGDLVLVQARLPKATKYNATVSDPAAPFVARKLIDKTNAPVDDEQSAPATAPGD